MLPQQSSLGSSQLVLALATALVTARVKNTPAASDAAAPRHLTLPVAYSGQGKLPWAAQIDIAASPKR